MADRTPTPEEIQALADELEVPVELAGQLQELATDLDDLSRAVTGPGGAPDLDTLAEILGKIGECLRLAALRVPPEKAAADREVAGA